MGRPLRIEYPDAFYHITARGNERKNIFKSNSDRERFLGYLESAFDRYRAIIHTYCLMCVFRTIPDTHSGAIRTPHRSMILLKTVDSTMPHQARLDITSELES